MEVEEIRNAKTNRIGKKIEYYEQIDSTHKYAQRIVEKEKNRENDGKVIIAEVQTDGIGTKGRQWYTGKSKNIALTMILNTDKKAKDLKDLPIEVAKAIQKSIYDLYGYTLEIKPPNDLMLNGKKICGILTQINTLGEEIQYILISFGFNVNEDNFVNYDSEEMKLKEIATSLKHEFKKEFKREEIISKILESIEKIEL